MSREIKFRAWDSRIKAMFMSGQSMPDLVLDFNGKIYHEGYGLIESLKLMQFTGLHDKNGVEIYEGDILRCHSANFTGKVWYEYGMFMSDCRGGGDDPLGWLDGDDIEVIGNIHENPELLEEL